MEEGTCFVYLSGKSRIESLDVAENNNNMYVDACCHHLRVRIMRMLLRLPQDILCP